MTLSTEWSRESGPTNRRSPEGPLKEMDRSPVYTSKKDSDKLPTSSHPAGTESHGSGSTNVKRAVNGYWHSEVVQ